MTLKIRLLSVGKPRDTTMVALHDRYAGRIRAFGVDYEVACVPETRAGGCYSDEHAREREGRRLREALSKRERCIALHAAGRELSSEELSEHLPRWASPRATLVVGGPSGLAPAVVEVAEFRWSLSRLTFPHELVRVLVAEQLYRALSLQRGVPYHR